MKVEDIPADEIIVMTDLLHRIFNTCGCNPMCHCCNIMIKVGDKFKLATVEKTDFKYGSGNSRLVNLMIPTGEIHSKEVMLCETCTAEEFQKKQHDLFTNNRKEYEKQEEAHKKSGGGCFRINGKIVH